MRFHLVISLIICAYCISMALARSIGYEDYDAGIPKYYNNWFGSPDFDFQVETIKYEYNKDDDNSEGDNSKELYQGSTLDVPRIHNDWETIDYYNEEYNKYEGAPHIISVTDLVIPIDGGLFINDDATNEGSYASEYMKYYGTEEIPTLEPSNEEQNDDTREATYKSDDDDDDDTKPFIVSCTPGNNGYICTSQRQQRALNTDYMESKEVDDLHAIEDTTDENAKESQYLTSSPIDYHSDLVRKLFTSFSNSDLSNSDLLNTEYSDKISDFKTVNAEADFSLWSLVFENDRIHNEVMAIANGEQDGYEYNSPQYRKLMDAITKMLADVDKIREKIHEMQTIEQKLNYHMLLKALLREIYGDNPQQANLGK